MTELRIPSLISLMETALVVEWPAARGSSKLVTSHTEDVVPEVDKHCIRSIVEV